MKLSIRPIRRKDARAFVRAHHSHHRGKTQAADVFRLSARVDGQVVAVAIMTEATAPALGSPEVWEVSRLCCGPEAPRYTASRLLGACGRVMDGAGVQLGISYTRIDERGTCYLAANWTPVALVDGRPHDTGNRAARWLPGLYEPSTEIIDRVRWERGPMAPTRSPEVAWDEVSGRWVSAVSRGSSRGSAPPDAAPISQTPGIIERANGLEPSTFSLGSILPTDPASENAGNVGDLAESEQGRVTENDRS